MRIALLALLSCAALLAGGILFAKYKLENLRQQVQARIAERVGARFEAGPVTVNGLRGLHIENLRVRSEPENGPLFALDAPSCRIDISLVDLLYGEVNIEHIQADGARLVLTRPPEAPWFTPSALDQPSALDLPGVSFRVVGKDWRVELINFIGNSRLLLTDVEFDIYRLPGARALTGHAAAQLGEAADKPMRMYLRYTSPEDFDVTFEAGRITADDINGLAADASGVLSTGVAQPRLRVTGYPAQRLVLYAGGSFQNLAFHGQPAFLRPASGTLAAFATYDIATREFTLTTAKANTPQLGGDLTGRVSFAGETPLLDLQLEAGNIPLASMFENAIPGGLAQFGKLDVQLADPSHLRVAFQGHPDDLRISATAELGGGHFSFAAVNGPAPAFDLQLGAATLGWSSETGFTGGTANILSGTLAHEAAGLKAQDVSGTIRFAEGLINIDPLNVQLTGNPFVGRLRYWPEEQRGEVEINGTLANIENTMLADGFPKTEIAGSAALRCSGAFGPRSYRFDMAVDATQAAVAYDWWFYKPAGIGASLQGVHVDVQPGKSISLHGNLDVATSRANFNFDIDWHAGEWRLTGIRAKADQLAPAALDQCLRIPYTVSGTPAADASFAWRRVNSQPGGAILEFGGLLKDVSLLPGGAAMPIRVHDARVTVTLDNSDSDNRRGGIVAEAAVVSMPPFGETWTVPLRNDPVLLEKFPELPRDWTFQVTAGRLHAPPWAGEDFACEGAFNDETLELEHFESRLDDDGSVEGSYFLDKPDNLYRLNARWQRAPAASLLRHMRLPALVSGKTTGQIDYSIDRDDPGTLAGTGLFRFMNGQFSADALSQQFGDFFQDERAPLPPSLRFSELEFELGLDGDRVSTPRLRLLLDGITLTGSGHFVTNADMNYLLDVSITPETAAKIPVFQDYFNVEGHRLSQNNIELRFQVSGPSFGPSSELVGLPSIGVSVVSGAAELGGEALRIIDTPRKILFDLFKIGGAIVGAGR